jgi:hypothetical protein
MSKRTGPKPLVSSGAEWLLFLGLFLPAMSLPLLVGAFLILESGAASRALGAALIGLSVVGFVVGSVMFSRRRRGG